MTQEQEEATMWAMIDSILSALPRSADLLIRMVSARENMEKTTGQKGCRLEKLSIELSAIWSYGSPETNQKITSRMQLGESSLLSTF